MKSTNIWKCLLPAVFAFGIHAAAVAENPGGTDAGKLQVDGFSSSLVPRGFVLQEDDYHIWCNAPILDDAGKVHLFVSRWPVKDTFGRGWHTTCEIAHYRADRPEGPYSYVRTVLKGDGREGSWRKDGTHNVTVVRLPDKRYAMLFIANSQGEKSGKSGKTAMDFPANQKIGLMLAQSPDGPWTLAGKDGLILDIPEDPDVWSHDTRVGVNNPTLLPMPDGRFFLYYKAMKPRDVRRMGLAIADKVEGPYRFEKRPLTENKGTIEDGFAFHLNSEPVLLVTDCHGEGEGGGMIYRSKDGIHFDQKECRAYEPLTAYYKAWQNPVHPWAKWAFQRPALLLDKHGFPTHLFAPCGTSPRGKKGTATFLFEIRPGVANRPPDESLPPVTPVANPGQSVYQEPLKNGSGAGH